MNLIEEKLKTYLAAQKADKPHITPDQLEDFRSGFIAGALSCFSLVDAISNDFPEEVAFFMMAEFAKDLKNLGMKEVAKVDIAIAKRN